MTKLIAWWIETPYPKTSRGKDLVGKQLVLDPERPPEDTSFSGMKMVFVKLVNGKIAPANWVVYKVMCTELDITTAIACMDSKKTFTFEENGDFPHIALYEESK